MRRILLTIAVCSIFTINMIAQETTKIKITVGSTLFVAKTYDNSTAKAFIALLPMTVNMKDVNMNEKFHPLQGNLPISPEIPSEINAGDLMLWGANGLVLFYETFTTLYNYTKIGYINNPTGLKTALGPNNTTVTFELLEN